MDDAFETRLIKEAEEPDIVRLCEVLEKGGFAVSDSALALTKKVGRH